MLYKMILSETALLNSVFAFLDTRARADKLATI